MIRRELFESVGGFDRRLGPASRHECQRSLGRSIQDQVDVAGTDSGRPKLDVRRGHDDVDLLRAGGDQRRATARRHQRSSDGNEPKDGGKATPHGNHPTPGGHRRRQDLAPPRFELSMMAAVGRLGRFGSARSFRRRYQLWSDAAPDAQPIPAWIGEAELAHAPWHVGDRRDG